jgi:hypothetical protein
MLKLRIGPRGSGKTSPTYDEVLATRGNRTVFVVSPCYEGGTPSKEFMRDSKRVPPLNFSQGIDWNYLLPQIKGRAVRIRVDEHLPEFINSLLTINDFILVLDDFQTIGKTPGIAAPLTKLYSLTRYQCDVYLTAHFYFKSFGSFLAQWREGADSILVYGPVLRSQEMQALMGEYNGNDPTGFENALKNNPKYHGIEIIQNS